MGANQDQAHLSINYSLEVFDTGAYDVQEKLHKKHKSLACDHHILDAVSLPEYSLMFTYSGGHM